MLPFSKLIICKLLNVFYYSVASNKFFMCKSYSITLKYFNNGAGITLNDDEAPDISFIGRNGETYDVDLTGVTTLGGLFKIDVSDRHQQDWSMGPSPVRNNRGPDIVDEALIWGILYTNGYYDATGNGAYYGTIVSKLGIGEFTASAGTPDHYWDQSIEDDWPPETWELPRVAVTRWETDM